MIRRHRAAAPFVVMLLVAISGVVSPLSSPSQAAGRVASTMAAPARSAILAELAAGAIDVPTSLVYRAFALFGDPRLPTRFAGPPADDPTLFPEVVRNWDRLPEETRQALTPFLVRPTDPRGAFRLDDPTTPGGPRGERGDGSKEARTSCADGWASGESELHPDGYKVWMPCEDDYEGDLARAVAVIDEFWGRLIELMGPPKPDNGGPDHGGDTRLDFYFIETGNESVPRENGAGPLLGESTLAVAMPTEPFEGNASSGFMVARRPRLDSEGIKLDLAHEFFHILQFSHNQKIGFGFRTRPYGQFDLIQFREFWFVEAMAVWAESYIYRGKIDPGTMVAEVHARFINSFQGVDLPLYESPDRDSPDFTHMYAAYIWFFFMEQEVGTEPVLAIWRKLETIAEDDWDGAMAIIDEALPFETHFRDFAVRNLNLDLQPGDPISPSYKDLDPIFPEGIRPPFTVGEGADRRLNADDERAIEIRLKSLTAHYFFFVPEAEVRAVTLDFSNLTPTAALDVDAIVKVKGGVWERRRLSPAGSSTFCFDQPTDEVEQIYLVLSNHDLREVTNVTGALTISSATAC